MRYVTWPRRERAAKPPSPSAITRSNSTSISQQLAASIAAVVLLLPACPGIAQTKATKSAANKVQTPAPEPVQAPAPAHSLFSRRPRTVKPAPVEPEQSPQSGQILLPKEDLSAAKVQETQPEDAQDPAGVKPKADPEAADKTGSEDTASLSRRIKPLQGSIQTFDKASSPKADKLDPKEDTDFGYGASINQQDSQPIKGSIFSSLLKPQRAVTDTQEPPAESPNNAEPFAGYALDTKQVEKLSKYKLELIIDRSESMKIKDCPGGLSRWDWCGFQAAEIAKALAKHYPDGITLTCFASGHEVYENSSPELVEIILQAHDFQYETRLSKPLKDRLEHYLDFYTGSDKPLLIAVITDGCPWPEPEPKRTIEALVDASHKMARPGLVKVVFLQIGPDKLGRQFLQDAGTNLVDHGARYQVAKTCPFEQLKSIGLARALADSLGTSESSPTHSSAALPSLRPRSD